MLFESQQWSGIAHTRRSSIAGIPFASDLSNSSLDPDYETHRIPKPVHISGIPVVLLQCGQEPTAIKNRLAKQAKRQLQS